MAICDQSRQHIDKEIDRTAMPSMLNLRNILELINDTLNNRSPAQQDFVQRQHQAVLHIFTQLSD